MVYYLTILLESLTPNRTPRRRGSWRVDSPVRRCLLTAALMSVGFASLTAANAQATTGYGLQSHFPTSIGTQAKGVAVDPATNDVYVASPFSLVSGRFNFNGALEQFSASGTLSTIFEINPPEPAPGFSGVAINPGNHNVYAYDARNQLIDAYDSAGAITNEFAEGTTASLPVTGGREVEVQIATDASGDIYYPNSALGEVQEYQPDGEPGALTITGLLRPKAVAVTSTTIYVLDENTSSGDPQVQQFDSSGSPVGSGILGAGVLADPQAVSVDESGNVFVLDDASDGAVVDEFGPTGTLLRMFGAGIIKAPIAIAVNGSSENVYVVEDEGFFAASKVLVFAPTAVKIPAAATEAAADVSQTGAIAVGAVTPDGSDTRVYFQYGTTTAYGEGTVPVDAGAGTTSAAVEVPLASLEPSRTYHYRVVATNAEGDREYGADREFTTLAAPPAVGTERASGITQSDAVLEAQIEPDNQATTCLFRYGTSPTLAGAASVPASPGLEVGSGFGESSVTQDVGEGLMPNTTYYFQAVAINPTGTTEGQIESFTTLPLAPTVEVPAASAITSATATLTGTLVTQGTPATYSFQYVADATFSASGFEHATSIPQPEGTLESEPNPAQVTTVVGGLTPDTTYHVRLVAVDAGGVTEGAESTFTTVVEPPAAATGLPIAVAPTAITVNAGVNPEHGQTTFQFEYVDEAQFLSSGYRSALSLPDPAGNAGNAGETQLVAATLTGLTPQTLYHYRVVATNAGGTTIGGDEMAMTPAEGVANTEGAGGSLFGSGGTLSLPGVAYPDLLSLSPTPESKSALPVSTSAKSLTRAQKLVAALKACKLDGSKSKRQACEKQAKKKYVRMPKKKTKKKKKS